MKKPWKITALYTAMHLLVDFCTVNLVLSAVLPRCVAPMQRVAVIAVYNFFAFACQLPLGILADRLDRNPLFAACGCLMAAASYPFSGAPIPACVLAGLGNAMFHLGGGIDVLNLSEGRAALPGIFVSSGAAGLFLAYRFTGVLGAYLPPVILLLAAFAIGLSGKSEGRVRNAPLTLERPKPCVVIAAACFLLTIVLRSYMGMILEYPWKTGSLSVLFMLAVVAGKALGGVLADRLGSARLAGGSLLLAALLFGFSFSIPAAGIAAVCLFNMTMPVTLTELAAHSGGKNGTAFGMTTLALFVGFVPVVLDKKTLFTPACLAAGAVFSALLMLCGFFALPKRGKFR